MLTSPNKLLTFPTRVADDYLLQGPSAAIARMWTQVHRVAAHFRSVLLIGAPGSGADAVARSLHALAPGAATKFHALDRVAAEQQLQPANALALEGFLWIAEADCLSPQAQRGLLRRIRQRHRSIRIAAAVRTDLRSAVSAGRFDAALAESLSAIRIAVPLLAERNDDLPMLLANMLDRAGSQQVPDQTFLAATAAASWPHNLAQLAAVVAHAATLDCTTLTASDFAAAYSASAPPAEAEPAPKARMVTLDSVLNEHVHAVLAACAGNKLRAAHILGISRSTLYRMLETTGLHAQFAMAG